MQGQQIIDRFGRVQPEITKTSLGASEMVPWEHVTSEEVDSLCRRLVGAGYELVAVEQTDQSIDFRTYSPAEKTAFIFGNEVDGVHDVFLAAAPSLGVTTRWSGTYPRRTGFQARSPSAFQSGTG